MMITPTAWADDDHERARLLLEQGKVLSLSEIMHMAKERFPGKILEIELEEKDGEIVYEIEFLGHSGVIMKMVIDARSGQFLSLKEE